ncbi:MAG: hypothetical protein IJM59_05535 [Proteobacteria bacterium]|nr:hypothetical protein [Pseudomonadota bacterium]
MRKWYFKSMPCCVLAAASFALPTAALADCGTLNEDDAWNQGFMHLQKQVETARYSEALETAKTLFTICQDSPALLYYTGLAMRGTGDEERAKIYFQKSSENLSIMAAEPGLSRKIWYTRYESEHPESTADAIQEKEHTIQNLTKEVADLNEENHRLELSSVELTASSGSEAQYYQQIMWAGIGVGIGGLALTATGIALTTISRDEIIKFNKNKDKVSENKIRVAGWALMGTGIGLLASGIVTACISGYHYSRAKDDAVMSFQASPIGASFSMTF